MSNHHSFGTYKIRVTRTPRQISYSIGLPPEVATPLAGKKFEVCVTDEGILLVPSTSDAVQSVEVVAAPEALAIARMFPVAS
jgi:hypothetical protein